MGKTIAMAEEGTATVYEAKPEQQQGEGKELADAESLNKEVTEEAAAPEEEKGKGGSEEVEAGEKEEEGEEAPEEAVAEEAEEEAEEEPEQQLKVTVDDVKTAPMDYRFPTTNQAKHCYTRYNEYHKCVAEKGDDNPECAQYARYYRSLCPGDWIDKWNEQRENGTFAGRY